ncbi:MAG: hypothetical protein K2L52_00735, partial [Clostridia bacterium]|nr:hypothetical protein [Clostridia bacterium]
GASNEWYFVVVPQAGMEVLTIEWSDTEFLHDGKKHIPTYVVKDRNGNVLDNASVKQILTFDNYEEKTEIATYTVKVTVKDSDRYFIRSGAICKFKIVEELGDEPPAEGEEPVTPPSGDNPTGGSGTLDELLKQFKEFLHWQLIVSPICILLIVIFAGKGASYLSKSKQNKKMAESRYKTYYAWTALGLASASWTVIACVLIGLAVLSFVFMLIAKSKFNKSLIYAEGLREEYERNKEEIAERKREEEKENMRMMLMGMMGGNAGTGQGGPQGAYMGGYGLGAEEIRGIVSETMTAMLPGVQQMLPQQASTNDGLVEKLIEQNEKLMQQLSEQKNTERIVEREVASSSVNDEAIKSLIEGQRIIMEKLANQSNQPQVVEKVIEKEVPVEKIVEKEIVKEVPVEVEKIVEKEVRVEVPVEVEKIVEKEVVKEVKVEVPIKAEPKPKKEVAPRLTLDEAYALLTKEQKKYFDGLKEYVLTKYKCKEKKST